MTLTITMTNPGEADVLQPSLVDLPEPAPDEVRLRQSAIGVNFVDIYQRKGLYPLPALPAVLGVKGAGPVEAVGPSVDTVQVGDRVAYAGLPIGGYAQARSIAERTAAAAMLGGITAHMLLHRVFPSRQGRQS